VAMEFVTRYEAKYGADSVTQFAGDAWGAWQLLDDAARRALKTGTRPGTREFRAAMRDALETTTNLTIPNGVMNMNAKDHQGFDQRSRVMGVIRNGKFAYAGDK
jgi:branched-chain amino acid transport system substrate-binding protein